MRHKNLGRKLGIRGDHRKAQRMNMLTALILHGRVVTTLAKAKEGKEEGGRRSGGRPCRGGREEELSPAAPAGARAVQTAATPSASRMRVSTSSIEPTPSITWTGSPDWR